MCALFSPAPQVRLKEYTDALKEYKRENSKFFEVKERYKGAIAALEKDLQVGWLVGSLGCWFTAVGM